MSVKTKTPDPLDGYTIPKRFKMILQHNIKQGRIAPTTLRDEIISSVDYSDRTRQKTLNELNRFLNEYYIINPKIYTTPPITTEKELFKQYKATAKMFNMNHDVTNIIQDMLEPPRESKKTVYELLGIIQSKHDQIQADSAEMYVQEYVRMAKELGVKIKPIMKQRQPATVETTTEPKQEPNPKVETGQKPELCFKENKKGNITGPDTSRAADDLIVWNRIVKYHHGSKYVIYQDNNKRNCYERVDKETLCHIIKATYPGLDHSRNVEEVYKMIRLSAPIVDEFDNNKYYVNLRNGIYDLKEGCLIPHDNIKYYSRQQCPGKYDLDTPADDLTLWKKYFDELFEGDNSRVYEMIDCLSQSITPRLHYGRMYLLIGPAGTGKSTIQELTESLVGGPGYYSAQTLQKIGSRFGGSVFAGYYLNCVRDNPTDMEVQSISMLKANITSEPHEAEIKGVDQTENPVTKPTNTLFVFSLNNLPKFPNLNDTGLTDRIKVIRFDRKIRNTDFEDRKLSERLGLKFDSLVTHILIPRIKENLERERLKYIPTHEEIVLELSTLTHDLDGFKAFCSFSPDLEITKKKLQECLRQWESKNKRVSLSPQKFNSWLIAHGVKGIKANRKDKRVEVWQGIDLNYVGKDEFGTSSKTDQQLTEHDHKEHRVDTKPAKPKIETELTEPKETPRQSEPNKPINWPANKPTYEQLDREMKNADIPKGIRETLINNLSDVNPDIETAFSNTLKFWQVKEPGNTTATTKLDLIKQWFTG